METPVKPDSYSLPKILSKLRITLNILLYSKVKVKFNNIY